MTFTIKKTEWGYTAYHPNGTAIAHAATKALLEAYLKECA